MSFNHTCQSVKTPRDRVLVLSWQFEKAFVSQRHPQQSCSLLLKNVLSHSYIHTYVRTSTHLCESLCCRRWQRINTRINCLLLVLHSSGSSIFWTEETLTTQATHDPWPSSTLLLVHDVFWRMNANHSPQLLQLINIIISNNSAAAHVVNRECMPPKCSGQEKKKACVRLKWDKQGCTAVLLKTAFG